MERTSASKEANCDLWHRIAYFVLTVPLRIYSLTVSFFRTGYIGSSASRLGFYLLNLAESVITDLKRLHEESEVKLLSSE